MKSVLRTVLVLVLLAAVGAGLVWGYLAGRADDADDDAPVQAPPRAAQVNGQTVLNFDQQAQRTNGIAVTSLNPVRRSAATAAAATILDLQPILDLQSKYAAAQTAITQARAAATASQAEYKRLTDLNRNSNNVSLKSIETARAAAESDAATLNNAQRNLALLQDSARLHWSATLAGWIEKGSPQLNELLNQRAYLVQVTATTPGAWSAPGEASLQLPDGAHLSAHRITALPQIDPHLQAPAYLYLVPAHSGLVPGLNLPVSLPAGPLQNGLIIPQTAVVWAQGSPWCYVEIAPGKFTRQEVSTTNPVPGGWFVSGLHAARVVTGGAQTLLSEEFRSQIQSADED